MCWIMPRSPGVHAMRPRSAPPLLLVARRCATTPWLARHWVRLLRVSWLVITGLTLAHIIASLPYLLARFQRVCATCLLQPSHLRELQALGLSPGQFASYLVALAVLFALIYVAVGTVLFWRGHDDRMALFTAFALVAFGGTAFGEPADSLTPALAPWQALVLVLVFLGRATLFLLIFLFPDHQLAPRWASVPAALAVALAAVVTLLPGLSLTRWLSTSAGALLLTGLGVSGVTTQVYKYRHCSDPAQRQQTKWVVFGIALALAAQAGESAAILLGGPHVLTLVLGNLLVSLAFLLIPVSLALAILRYRLWDIDLLINRALVYTALTVGVACLYVLAVGALGALFHAQGNLAISLLA